MAFLQKFLTSLNPWKNLTWEWKEDCTVPLVLDLDTHQFSGVSIGDRVERLSFLGRGDVHGSAFRWPAKGIAAEVDGGHLRELHVFVGHSAEPDAGSFIGTCLHRGESVSLLSLTESQAVQQFGPPYWRDADEDEVILFYEFVALNLEWQCEFALDGQLKCFVLGNSILAQEEDRKAYGVTKAWPPS